MPSNTPFQASMDPAQPKILDKEVPHDGDSAKLQYVGLGIATGSEASGYTFRELAALDTLLQSLLTIYAPATATNAASGTADVQMLPATTSLRLMGYSSKENAGSPVNAEFILRNGTSTADTPLAHVKLGPNESVRDWFGPGGLIASGGIYLDRISGTTDITIHTVVAP